MKAIHFILFLCGCGFSHLLQAQSKIDSIQFFLEDNILNVKLSTDVGNLLGKKMKEDNQLALFSCKMPDSTEVSEEININLRGKTRRRICYVPPLRLNFGNPTSPRLSPLKSLKLVSSCSDNTTNENYLLKEYLIYKMYNILTDKSFRVRLLNITFEDTRGKKKPFTQYGFFVEDVDAMAKRNKCKEFQNVKINSENTDRDQMTLVALFEYMIGNTDWSVPNNHNIKLILPKKDSAAKPYPVPYDFDYAGLVNTEYAIPDPIMAVESVLQRVYRGFPRTMPELETAILVFNNNKDKIYELVKNFEPLDGRNKRNMIAYLDDFYKTINNPRDVKIEFINKARTE